MIRPKTSVKGLAATTAVALSALILSAGVAFGAPPSCNQTPPTEATPVIADREASVTAAMLTPELAPSAVSADDSAVDLAPDALDLNYCPVAQVDDAKPAWAVGPPHRRGYCRCSCGYPCKTSADCGGSSCDPFITCC